MKITRILPKFLAKTYQEEDLRRAEINLEYHRGLVRNLEYRVAEGRKELERLKKWDVKFVKSLTRILVDFSYGKTSKYVGYVVIFVTIFLGMEVIYKNTGVNEIELS